MGVWSVPVIPTRADHHALVQSRPMHDDQRGLVGGIVSKRISELPVFRPDARHSSRPTETSSVAEKNGSGGRLFLAHAQGDLGDGAAAAMQSARNAEAGVSTLTDRKRSTRNSSVRQSISAEGAAISRHCAGTRRRRCLPTSHDNRIAFPGERPAVVLGSEPAASVFAFEQYPRAPSFHVGAQRSALSSGSGGSAIAEPSGWSGSSASRNFHHTSARLFAKASCPSFVFSIDSHDATKDTGSIPLSFSQSSRRRRSRRQRQRSQARLSRR